MCVQGFGFRVLGLGFRVSSSGSRGPKNAPPPPPHSYEGTFGPFRATHFPLPYSLDRPYIPTVLSTAGAVYCSIAGYLMNPVEDNWVTTRLGRCAVLLCSFVMRVSLPGSKRRRMKTWGVVPDVPAVDMDPAEVDTTGETPVVSACPSSPPSLDVSVRSSCPPVDVPSPSSSSCPPLFSSSCFTFSSSPSSSSSSSSSFSCSL